MSRAPISIGDQVLVRDLDEVGTVVERERRSYVVYLPSTEATTSRRVKRLRAELEAC